MEIVYRSIEHYSGNGRLISLHSHLATQIMTNILIDSVRHGDTTAVKRAISSGMDVNQRDEETGLSPLMIAAGFADLESAKILVAAGADCLAVEPMAGASVLHKACQGGSVEVARILLDNGAFIDAVTPTTGHTPLMDALWYKWPDLTAFLLAKNANLNVSTHYGFTLQEHFEYELEVNTVGKDRLFECEKLLNRRKASDESALQTQLLMSAASRGATETVRRLISEGKSVNQRFPIVGGFNDGHTPLLVACRDGHYEVAKQLIDAGADVNAVEPVFGAVPLHKAVYNGRADITRLLIKQPKINLNFQGATNGYTPLHDALWHGHVDCATLLLDSRARTDIKGHDGKTPLCIARESLGAATDLMERLVQESESR